MKVATNPVCICALVAVGVKQASGQGLRSKKAERILSNRKIDVLHGFKTSFTFEELDIMEREALDVCDVILALFQTPIKSALQLPFEYGCNCDINWPLSIDFECGVNICADDITEMMGVNDFPLPTMDNFCFAPTYSGHLEWGPNMETELESGMSDLVIDHDKLAEMTLGFVRLEKDIVFEIPNIRISAKHEDGNIVALQSCEAQIDTGFMSREGAKSCSCEICGDWRTDIRLDCKDLLESFIPEPLRGFFEIEPQCIGIHTLSSMLFGAEDAALIAEEENPPIPFVSPFFSIVKPKAGPA